MIRKQIHENLQFLILEVRTQIETVLEVLESPDLLSVESLIARDDHIDNLKGVIESKCFSLALCGEEPDRPLVSYNRAVASIATNLERMADYAIGAADQTKYYRDRSFTSRFDFRPFVVEIIGALDDIHEGLTSRNARLGLRVATSEGRIDDLYDQYFHDILEMLRRGDDVEDLLTTIFILRYLERIGDCLLNVGEAIISAVTGEKLKLHQIRALQETLEEADADATIGDVELESIWETRSGSRIAHVDGTGAPGESAMFKDGDLAKLRSEKESIEQWERLVPGLPPRVLGFNEHGQKASLLLEWIHGETLETLALNSDTSVLRQAMETLEDRMGNVWTATLEREPANARHIGQLLARIDDVYRIHPSYRTPDQLIGRITAPSLDELVRRSLAIDARLDAPFSVLTHGDFNIDNVIYERKTGDIRFIDLHRTSRQDYTQDVSVFMVSAFRLPVMHRGVRSRLHWLIEEIYRFASGFAAAQDDATFDARLTLGLVRSLVSSTRFELQQEFARSMYMRAVYLLEKLLDHGDRQWSEFRLPQEALRH